MTPPPIVTEALYEQVMAAIHADQQDPPNPFRILVILGRFAGYSVSKCSPDKREFARDIIITHLDAALREASRREHK